MTPSQSERVDRYACAVTNGILAAHAEPAVALPDTIRLADLVFEYVDALMKERKKYEERIHTEQAR